MPVGNPLPISPLQRATSPQIPGQTARAAKQVPTRRCARPSGSGMVPAQPRVQKLRPDRRHLRAPPAITKAPPAAQSGGYFSPSSTGDPHVSLPTLALEKRGCDRCCSGEEPRTLLSVIEVNVFVDRATRSTSQTHDHDKPSERASDLRILGAALGNRTPDLRITRSPGRRSGPATCTDSSTPAPKCTQRTACTGFPVHDPVHDRDMPGVTECYPRAGRPCSWPPACMADVFCITVRVRCAGAWIVVDAQGPPGTAAAGLPE